MSRAEESADAVGARAEESADAMMEGAAEGTSPEYAPLPSGTSAATAEPHAAPPHAAVPDAAAAPSSVGAPPPPPPLKLVVRWSGKPWEVELRHDATVGDLKVALSLETLVPVARQKLSGLAKGAAARNVKDDTRISDLALKRNAKLMMIGTADAAMLKVPDVLPDVVDDLAFDYEPTLAASEDPENALSLQKKIAKTEINVINPPRPGKKLLVVDLDHCVRGLACLPTSLPLRHATLRAPATAHPLPH